MREPCVLRTIFDLRGDIVVSTGRLRTGEPALLGVYHHSGLPDSPNYSPINRLRMVIVAFHPDGRLSDIRQLYDPRLISGLPLPQDILSQLQTRLDSFIGDPGPIVALPFHSQHQHIHLVAEWPGFEGPLPTQPGIAHHSLWWGQEYWLDIGGGLVRLGREHPDQTLHDICFQLRLSIGDRLARAEDLRRFDEFCRHTHSWLPIGRYIGPSYTSEAVTFCVEDALGAHWDSMADPLHTELNRLDLSSSMRLVLVRKHRLADGTPVDRQFLIKWPRGGGEIESLDDW